MYISFLTSPSSQIDIFPTDFSSNYLFAQETYSYYELPFCKPEHGIETEKKASGIGEFLEGNVLRNSGLKLHFASEWIVINMRNPGRCFSSFPRCYSEY